ncbi:MAG: hemerythrin domain-containing protein [Gammaproteobacteria bacterium]|nr:hemerythrin domain-containing protein [Gammaproteobacteria bacterium]MCW8923012.1 hemerythrin domain-containing protein [Gammaproteobacteria bacterium]
MKIREFMAQDHKDCDQLFAIAENAASQGDWDTATQAFNDFVQAMERHLGIEENELFPAFEEASGMTMGPTEMMRSEHDQMRVLFAEMREAVDTKHADDYLGVSETLLILMQQHNMKEEQILYSMMDQHLSDDNIQLQQKFQDWDKG